MVKPVIKKKKTGLMAPIYQKRTRDVDEAISDRAFYTHFMEILSGAQNDVAIFARKQEKTVDLNWVEKIEETIPAIQSIVSNPRNVIKDTELVVNAANARRVGPAAVRHLIQHTSYVEKYDEATGEVRPARLMQKYREDSEDLYENRLVFTTMEIAYQFVKRRYDKLVEAGEERDGTELRVCSDLEQGAEQMHLELCLRLQEKEPAAMEKETLDRIEGLYRQLNVLMHSQFALQMEKYSRVKGNIVRTNVLKRNPDYRRVMQLMDYLRMYAEPGYTVRRLERSLDVDETFRKNILYNVMCNYIALKDYLEGEQKQQNEEEQALLRDCEQQLEQFAHSLARQKAKRTEQI